MKGRQTFLPTGLCGLSLRLQELRRQGRLSQEDAGLALLGEVGPKTISSFESGARIHSITLAQLLALCRAYGIKASELLGEFGE